MSDLDVVIGLGSLLLGLFFVMSFLRAVAIWEENEALKDLRDSLDRMKDLRDNLDRMNRAEAPTREYPRE
jgi:hypothetical protein